MEENASFQGRELEEVRELLRLADESRKRCEAENTLLKSQVQSARNDMEHFIYAASHDFQQPLRAITAYAQLLERDLPPDQRTRDFIGFILEGATQMTQLLRDLLTYSRSGNACELQELNLNGPFQWSLYSLAKAIDESQTTVKSSSLPVVNADEKQMVTMFEQLIGNAIKFRGKSPLVVEVEGETNDDCHVITVRDNGMGIEPQYSESVFQPFKRLHGKEYPGSGLGLSICRKIMNAHGGRIWLESDGLSGSSFYFSLPV